MRNLAYFPENRHSLERLLEGFFEEMLRVRPTDEYDILQTKELFFLAVYKNDAGENVILATVEFTLAVALATMFTRFPRTSVPDILKNKTLTPELYDNLRELMNIVSSLFNYNACIHVALGDMFLVNSELEKKYIDVFHDPEMRLDVKIISDTGHGEGRLSLYKAKQVFA